MYPHDTLPMPRPIRPLSRMVPSTLGLALGRGRVTAGFPLFPNLNADNFNRNLKTPKAELGFGRWASFSSHAFRSGATDEIKNCGSTLATILKSGAWLSAPYRNYLDLQADEAIDITTFLIDGIWADSEDSDPNIDCRKRRGANFTRRMRGAPLTFMGDRVSAEEDPADETSSEN